MLIKGMSRTAILVPHLLRMVYSAGFGALGLADSREAPSLPLGGSATAQLGSSENGGELGSRQEKRTGFEGGGGFAAFSF
jgi:hypothetical protein